MKPSGSVPSTRLDLRSALESNHGFGEGNNRGVDVALQLGCEELLFLNPDAWLDPSGLRRLHDRVRGDAGLLVAPRVLRPNGRLYSDANDLYLDSGETLWTHLRGAEVDPTRVRTWVSGACFAMTADLWKACGGFDHDYFLYWEDVDLAHRVTSVGGRVLVDRDVSAVHDEGASQRPFGEPATKTPTYLYYNARNRLVYAGKNLSPSDQRKWLIATPRASYAFVKQAGRARFTRPWQILWPAARGTWHGIRLLRANRHRGRAHQG